MPSDARQRVASRLFWGRVGAALLLAGSGLLSSEAYAGDDSSKSAAIAAPAKIARDSGWAARLPAQDKIDYRGAVNFDAAGSGPGTMLYPAPGLAGFLVAVATHAVIINSVRGNEKSKIQLEADKVLLPYQAALSAYDHRTLFQSALEKTATSLAKAEVLEARAAAGGTWVVESAPVFLMTQDQRALILENTVAVFAPGPAAPPVYQNLVRVVSVAEPEDDIASRWNADQGLRLKERSAELLARSFEIAIDAAGAPAPGAAATQRTFRYPEGGRERMERAQLVSAGCDRVVIRTLRGWLMSVPVRSEDAAAAAPCAGSLVTTAVAGAAGAAPPPAAASAAGLTAAR